MTARDYVPPSPGTHTAMNETIAKLTDHLPLDDLNLEKAVSTAKAAKHHLEKRLPVDDLSLDHAVSSAKAAKHHLEQRYKKPARKSKARFIIPVLLAAVAAAFVARKFLSSSEPSAQPAPASKADDVRVAASNS